MWQNVQGYYGGSHYYQSNCSNPNCLNPYCQCGAGCRCDHIHQYRGENKPIYEQHKTGLRDEMRRLWSEHVAWIQMTVSSLVLDSPDSSSVVARLLRTAKDMGDSLRPFYGNQVGDAYGQLLREHITLAGDLIKASKEGNKKKSAGIGKSWYQNGEEISVFLNSINPYIPLPEFKKMFHEHLDMSKSEVVSMMNGDYDAYVAMYDMMLTGGLEIADVITSAIMQQFPGN